MIYKEFRIQNFKGLDDISISFEKNDLVLLLGINESGKTTILKAIEAFDYINDPRYENMDEFYKSIRRKSDTQSNKEAIITAKIEFDKKFEPIDFSSILRRINKSEDLKTTFESFLYDINKEKCITISRVFPFKNGNPKGYNYRIDSDHPFTSKKISQEVAEEIVKKCSFIIYFEDFKDRIPDKILINKKSEAFNNDWYEIIDGLFYTTDKNYSIDNFKKYFYPSQLREDDAHSELNKVNHKLNEIFTVKWKSLSGVKDIDKTDLKYNQNKKYFEIKIIDKDGTNYSIDERSKGALWYLSFLMKTEFRRKKLKHDFGKSIFLIDEPASNLHSTAQTNMIKDFIKLVEEEDSTVIYSTHSQYLISTSNIKSTYIVKRENGIIECVKWSDYIKHKNPNTTYYQPLLNHLQIIPNDFTIPWEKAIITEGPSDRHVLKVMYKCLNPKKKKKFVIYPGTSAHKLNNLISLNIGWGANFNVILDSDKVGLEKQKDYIKEFKLDENIVHVLPIKNKKIEGLFSEVDKNNLYKLVFEKSKEKRITKNEFSNIFSLLVQDENKIREVHKILEKSTLELFTKLFSSLTVT